MADLSTVQSRKWQVTINNPDENGFYYDTIKTTLSLIRGSKLYWCFCYEEGDECKTTHVHIFLYRSSPFTAETINSLFPCCHREKAFGTCSENRAYVLKDGPKFNKDFEGNYSYTDSTGKLHEGKNFSNTFEESGPCPEEHQGKSHSAELVIDLIKRGASDEDIVDAVPSCFRDLEKVQRTRSLYRDSEFKKKWRDLHVSYIFGKTGSGKTRSVMEQFGYENCYRVTDYKHPFDNYEGQDVIIFEEFRSGIKHGDMLSYLDGYPLLLPCRYFNRQACYTKVFILSNIPIDQQYQGINEPETIKAFYRRIHEVVEIDSFGFRHSFPSVYAFLHRHDWVQDSIDPDLLPFAF